MIYPRWPEALPKPTREGLTIATGDGRSMTNPDAGTPRQRRRFSRAFKPVSMTLILTNGERGLFEDFCQNTLEDHSLAFVMPDPTSDGWPLTDENDVPLTDENDVPLLMTADWLVMFGEALPAFAMAGIDFRVSFQLRVMPI